MRPRPTSTSRPGPRAAARPRPGGPALFAIRYWNDGDIAGSARLTDNQLIWDLGALEVNAWQNVLLHLQVDRQAAPGTAITNCIAISASGFDGNPYNNRKCVTETVWPTGPNLRVNKFAWHRHAAGRAGVRQRARPALCNRLSARPGPRGRQRPGLDLRPAGEH